MVREAELKDTDAGLVPASTGWFVMNVRDARWFHKPGQDDSVPLTGYDEFEAETYFPMLGMAIRVVSPGEPTGTYHWETEQEDFLVLAGECVVLVEGEERRLRRWDFVHCPPGTEHIFVGAGAEPCVILMVGARGDDWNVVYPVSDLAARYGASADEETTDPNRAYEPRFEPSRRGRPSYWDRLPWA